MDCPQNGSNNNAQGKNAFNETKIKIRYCCLKKTGECVKKWLFSIMLTAVLSVAHPSQFSIPFFIIRVAQGQNLFPERIVKCLHIYQNWCTRTLNAKKHFSWVLCTSTGKKYVCAFAWSHLSGTSEFAIIHSYCNFMQRAQTLTAF